MRWQFKQWVFLVVWVKGLSVLCDTIRHDVLADEVIRNTAFETVTNEKKKSLTPTSKKDGLSSSLLLSLEVVNGTADRLSESKSDLDDNYESSAVD